MKNLFTRLRQFTETLRSSQGFTLIELMIVVVIISILAGTAVMIFRGPTEKAKKTAVANDFSVFETALERYYLDHDSYPSTEDGLQKLIDEGLLKDKKKTLLDPWDNPYVYHYPAENGKDEPEIICLGADRQVGGEGINADFSNLEE